MPAIFLVIRHRHRHFRLRRFIVADIRFHADYFAHTDFEIIGWKSRIFSPFRVGVSVDAPSRQILYIISRSFGDVVVIASLIHYYARYIVIKLFRPRFSLISRCITLDADAHCRFRRSPLRLAHYFPSRISFIRFCQDSLLKFALRIFTLSVLAT